MKLLRVILLLAIITIGGWFYFSYTYPETSPLTSGEYFLEHLGKPHAELSKYVLGFLPYWELNEINYIKPTDLSEINYFSLSVGPDGHILKTTNGQNDPGWNGWIQQATKDFITKSHIMGTKVAITIAAQDNETIKTLLNSNTAQQNLIADILTQVQQRKLNGVNIDFEYTGTPNAVYQQEFTYFSEKLSSQLKLQNPQEELDLSIMPVSATQTDLYDFQKLIPLYDHFIGMTYDYYGPTSDIAGPVAPMKGFAQGKYFFDVTTTYSNFEKLLPKNKLIMGVAYYGWEWAVENGSTVDSETLPSSNPNSYAAIISYARYREDTDIKQNQCSWESDAEETWCWFTDTKTGIDHQLWPMDNKAINIRFDYANQQDLDGIAIWTLGLDKNYPDLWNLIEKTF